MKKIALLMCLVMLSGCSWMRFWEDESDIDLLEPAELVDFEPSVKVRKIWSSGGVGEINTGTSNIKPAHGNGAIYAADSDGRVVAVDEHSGKVVWKKDLDDQLTGGVGFGANQVLVGSVEGQLYVLSAENGAILWVTDTSSEILAAPASNGKQVVVQTQDGKLKAFDADSGAPSWQFEIDVPVLTIRGTSSPMITHNMVFAAFANGKVYAFRADNGLLMWEARVAIPAGRTELERIVDIDGDMLLEEDILYAVSFQGRLGAFARGTGRSLWFQDVSSHRKPGFGLGQIYITDEDDIVRAYRSSSGQPLWSNDQMRLRLLTSPVTVAGYVAVADDDGYLHVLSQSDGSFVGRKKIDGSGVSADMIASDDKLFVLDNDGSLRAFSFN